MPRMLLPIFIMVSVLFFRIEIIWHVLGKSLLFPFSCTFAYAWEKQNMHTLKLNWLHLLSSAYCMRIILFNSIVFSLFGFQVLKLGLFLRNQSEIIAKNRMKKRLSYTAPFLMTLEYFQKRKYVHNFKHM